MKTRSRLLTTLATILLTGSVYAQWENTSFPTSMPNKIFATSDGHILVGEYSRKAETGLYIMTENGDKCEKADLPQYMFTAFVEADGYVYAFADKAKIAVSKDCKKWELISYANALDTPEEQIQDCYAAAYYNGRIYCAPFKETPVYSEDGGKKWIKTDVSGVDPENTGYSYLYGMIVFKERLYAYGSEGIFRLKEDGESWEMVRKTNYTSYGMIMNDVLYITNDNMGAEEYMWKTEDGDNWTTVEIPQECMLANSIGAACVVDNKMFIGSNIGIFYSQDNLQTWQNISEGFPYTKDLGGGAYYYAKPTRMVYSNNYLFSSAFTPTGKGGVYRLDLSKLSNKENTVDKVQIKVDDSMLTVYGIDNAYITIASADGRTVANKRANFVNISSLPEGIYIYTVQTDNNKYSGKFIK